MKHTFLIVTMLIALGIGVHAQQNSAQCFIYGKCQLVSGDEVEGFITLNGQRLWVAQFVAMKMHNAFARYFSGNANVRFGKSQTIRPSLHQFSCRFRDIQSIRPVTDKALELTSRDGNTLDVSYNPKHFFSLIQENNREYKLTWDQVSSIEFMSAPEGCELPFPAPVMARVQSVQGTYEGLVVSVDANNISKPIPLRGMNLSLDTVSFLSAESMTELSYFSTNAPNGSYGGGEQKANVTQLYANNPKYIGLTPAKWWLAVYMPNFGTVSVTWPKIKTLTRISPSDYKGYGYNDNVVPKRLSATVTTRNKEDYSGFIAYDLDETMNFEFITGRNDDIIYNIVLDAVRLIEPKNFNFSLIVLKGGGRISLGDGNDVDGYNEGIMMLNQGMYIPWRDVLYVNFEMPLQ